MITRRNVSAMLLGGLVAGKTGSALARTPNPAGPPPFSPREIVDSGHQFFGGISRGLGKLVEEATRRWGQPNGYILGQEASGAFFGGLRYGEGTVFTRRGDPGSRIYWQGPSIGFDVGGEGARQMMLIYNLASVPDMYRRFVELEGSAYFVAGLGMSAATADRMVVVPIRSGVGVRLGVALGYLKFTPTPTWNPF
ncbi:DUF1134 domain-containing protein [Enterovirga rhinocerotis]|uniref:DUF1134 domain-containing protein n=1 Tax=Enterovirga rhinocerotis TaxID=1339210 RepID=A0A4R7C5F3_9HYPH|nr:DUF1134 domain-containing protein [Enterovirga rhinocerotis]TDR93411.1 hypothetical protein EV668_0672 [Enterovirga rhinocerotis]